MVSRNAAPSLLATVRVLSMESFRTNETIKASLEDSLGGRLLSLYSSSLLSYLPIVVFKPSLYPSLNKSVNS